VLLRYDIIFIYDIYVRIIVFFKFSKMATNLNDEFKKNENKNYNTKSGPKI
jgi:hypothetical protein